MTAVWLPDNQLVPVTLVECESPSPNTEITKAEMTAWTSNDFLILRSISFKSFDQKRKKVMISISTEPFIQGTSLIKMKNEF